jgi:hypothetical protein
MYSLGRLLGIDLTVTKLICYVACYVTNEQVPRDTTTHLTAKKLPKEFLILDDVIQEIRTVFEGF